MQLDEIKKLDWEKNNGLLPAIVQHAQSGQVLMLGYMNQQSLTESIKTKKVTFFSRSRQALWVKGETSGNYLHLVDISTDCDNDSLLVLAMPEGPTCHLGLKSCFNSKQQADVDILFSLQEIIKQRQQDKTPDSYTVSLLESGLPRIAQKVGEEGVETVIAALAQDDETLANELSDLLYHILVLLRARNIDLSLVLNTLKGRNG